MEEGQLAEAHPQIGLGNIGRLYMYCGVCVSVVCVCGVWCVYGACVSVVCVSVA